jgi:hypothetical protein
MGDDIRRQALARDLARRQQLLGLDELRVLDRLQQRLELGRDRYGELDLRAPRAWRRELGEELLDAVVYDTIDNLRAEDAAHEELQAQAAAELAEWSVERRTTVSREPARLALEDLDDPYAEWGIEEA